MTKYKTIYADPPWSESGGGRIKRGADRHYNLMKTKEIIALKRMVLDLSADNSHLYLWVTNNFLKDGLHVMEEWGFRYITNICWAKPSFGLGQYFRGQHELCLFGVRGRLLSQAKPKNVPSLIFAEKGIHSQKPPKMYEYIERTSPPPRIELFARNKRKDWDTWGNIEIKEKQEVLYYGTE